MLKYFMKDLKLHFDVIAFGSDEKYFLAFVLEDFELLQQLPYIIIILT